jgi:ABC-type transport system involved in Fe-S cluster assembly fused permease/ATPase subunit
MRHMRTAATSSSSRSERPDLLGLSARTTHWTVLRSLLPYIWPAGRPDLRAEVAGAFVVLVIAKLVTVAVPVLFKWATDWLATDVGGSPEVAAKGLALGVAMVIVAYGTGRVLMMVLNQIRDVLFTRVGQHAIRELNNRTFRHLHKLSLRFHLARRTGGLSRVIERGTRGIDLIVRMGVMQLAPTVIEMVLVAVLLVYYFSWTYVLILLATVVAYMWFTFAASERRIAIRREMNESDTEANTKAIDSLLNYETVKYFGNEEAEARRFDVSMARYEKAAVKTYYSLGVLNSGQALIFTIGMTLVMWLTARGVMAGTHTVGDFVMINAVMIQLYMPLNFMGMVYREIKQGLVDLETMFALLAEQPEVEDRPGARPLDVREGTIRFENVSFSYDPERQILHGLSFEVPAGKMVAIVGPSGAGKSTISRILFRFYDIDSGRVTIDGQDIRDVTQLSLRLAIGVVPQDTVLFNDTILYNIRYGRPDATDAEVHEAARLAQIDRFIALLPEGYATMVGERGLKLSGGEKQRVAIARTLLKAPPILMLDEATSALDSHTEKEIQDALDRVAANRTTLVIAHRLSTIVHADDILVLDKGHLVERGTHAELIAKDGLYASLWSRQRQAEKAREELAAALEAGLVASPAPGSEGSGTVLRAPQAAEDGEPPSF